jgi:hypothetical protein
MVLSSSDIEALYVLHRYDVLINKNRLSELRERVELSRDPRTGRPVVSTPESVALLIDCFPDGLIVTSEHRWRVSHQLNDAVANYIIEHTVPLELPKPPQMMAFAGSGRPTRSFRRGAPTYRSAATAHRGMQWLSVTNEMVSRMIVHVMIGSSGETT